MQEVQSQEVQSMSEMSYEQVSDLVTEPVEISEQALGRVGGGVIGIWF